MLNAYSDLRVLVTGASTGLGRAIAVGAAQAGAASIAANKTDIKPLRIQASFRLIRGRV